MDGPSNRREFLRAALLGPAAAAIGAVAHGRDREPGFRGRRDPRPNILLCLADDWGPNQASVLGDRFISTPTFDALAESGVLFTNAFVATPSCTASRAAILTGQWPHRLGEAFNLSSNWTHIPALYTDLLRAAGYHVGYTRKGWGPGIHEGRPINPAGEQFEDFEAFLSRRPPGKPFCFWFGSNDPHRPYEAGLAAKEGFDPGRAPVPSFLPDVPDVRRDLADYYAEIKRFDVETGRILEILSETAEAANTIVVMTGDNGLPFPRAKAHLYAAGTRAPLAIRWPAAARGGRRISDFVSFTDFAPTFLEAAGIPVPRIMTGRSLAPLLFGGASGRIDPRRDKVFTERERHTWCHPDGKSFPVRAVRTDAHLYIRNLRPELFPAGHPFLRREKNTPKGHVDCDEAPSKYFLIDHRDDPGAALFYRQAFARRPAEELYDLRSDPSELTNIAGDPARSRVLAELRRVLADWMKRTGDPRAEGETGLWDASCWHQQPRADIRMPGYEEADPRT
jgi:N-sulfoglucosamine sulfohydrolase